MEVRKLLSQAGLDMSRHASGNSTPKRLEPVVLVTPLPTKLEDFHWPVDTSSQVSTPDDAEMEDTSLEEIPAASSPTAKTPGPSGGVPPSDTAHLWEDANKALRELLLIKSSIDTHQKLVWKLSMALCQNDSKTVESIKKAKVVCTCSIQEAETLCSTAIMEAEAWGASQVGSLQQLHAKTIQCLEEEAIKEESKGQFNFISTCQAALWASPSELCGMLVASYHILLGHVPMSHPFSTSQGASPSGQGSAPGAPSPSAPKFSPRSKQWHHSADPADVLPPSGTMSK